MDSQQDDEQNSFQALKNKWAQQENVIKPTTNTTVISPPPIPPKPVLFKKDEVPEEEQPHVSVLAQQFDKLDVKNPGNFSSLPPSPTAIKKAPPPPPAPPVPATSSSSSIVSPTSTNAPQFLYQDMDPFTIPDSESSDGDSDEEDEEDAYLDHHHHSRLGTTVKEGDTSLIEQVQKAHLQYTKLEESRFIGTPAAAAAAGGGGGAGVGTSAGAGSRLHSSTKKPPPPPPPPSKKYHRSNMIPMTKPESNRSEFNPHPSTIVDTTLIAPPTLPPRPIIPQLPPRPSQSTLARAHTIASSHGPPTQHLKPPMHSPASVYTDNSDLEDDNTRMKRANTVSFKRPMTELLITSSIYPDFSKATRNAPYVQLDQKPFSTGHKTIYALSATKNLIMTGSNLLRTWDVDTGSILNTVLMDNNTTNNTTQDNNDRIRAIVIAPCRIPYDEGRYVWVARQDTMLTVVDIRAGSYKVLSKRNDVHMSPITFLLRFGNSEIWSIDDAGILNVWDVVSADYQHQNPLLTAMPRRYHVTSHAVAATIYGSKLWMSSGRTLAAHAIPSAGSQLGTNDTKSQPPVRIPNDMGNITKLMTIPYHPDRIFASHDDGKISIWDTKTMERLQVITVSMYGICTMTCVGEYHVWAGYNTGMIYVYDTRPEKWKVLKMWKAHTGAVTHMVVDESSLLLDEIKGRLQVVSSDSNGYIGVWDGLLTEHWKEDHLNQRAQEYCTYDEARVMICSWNIDASKPERIVGDDDKAVREWLGTMEDPDIIVVGIQEIVDLESKKQTARSLFSRKKADQAEAEEVLTRRYKLWHDYLVRMIGENYGHNAYTVIKTDQLVGLFSCIFVRTSDINRVFNVDSTSVKTGLKVMNKSIHGNKGGIAIRFMYDHSSLCFVNCHLAAGQSHVQQRNADAEGILQSANFAPKDYADVFSHGGDGSMILDHEFCFLSGDLNYRIKMSHNDVLTLLKNPDKLKAWEKLQQHDQLLRQNSNNPLFKLLQFEEAPIRFDPTYKYDPGTDYYDRSEKKRIPAWCDRVLYKGNEIKNLYYRRYEARCSDHRPIAAGFSFQTKVTDQEKRDRLMANIEEEWRTHIDRFTKDKKARYVADYERCTLNEAFGLLEKSDWDVNDTVIKLLGSV